MERHIGGCYLSSGPYRSLHSTFSCCCLFCTHHFSGPKNWLGFTTLERLAVLNNQLLQTFQLMFPSTKGQNPWPTKSANLFPHPTPSTLSQNQFYPHFRLNFTFRHRVLVSSFSPSNRKNIGEFTLSPHLPNFSSFFFSGRFKNLLLGKFSNPGSSCSLHCHKTTPLLAPNSSEMLEIPTKNGHFSELAAFFFSFHPVKTVNTCERVCVCVEENPTGKILHCWLAGELSNASSSSLLQRRKWSERVFRPVAVP